MTEGKITTRKAPIVSAPPKIVRGTRWVEVFAKGTEDLPN